MVRNCCVTGCGTGYDADDKTRVFILPKDQLERSRWIQAIPRDNILNSFDTVVCENHWPSGYEKVLSYGRHRPKSPRVCFFVCLKVEFPLRLNQGQLTRIRQVIEMLM